VSSCQAWSIEIEQRDHQQPIESLYEKALGPGRFAKTAERLREGNSPVADLCMVAFEKGELRASVRFWPIRIGQSPALLLGPLVVEPAHKDRGFGQGLMQAALAKARSQGHTLVILVGDEPYYARAGFRKIPPGTVHLPGPVDLNRLLVCDLSGHAAQGMSGTVTANPGHNGAGSRTSFPEPARQQQDR